MSETQILSPDPDAPFEFIVEPTELTTIEVEIVAPDDKPIREIPIGYFFDEDTFELTFHPDYYSPGTIFEGDQSNNILKGTFDNDIFISENITNFIANGYDGSDIFIYWSSAGVINAGTGGDIIDLTNFHGIINLGNDLDSDILLVWEVLPDSKLKVDNYDPEHDFIFYSQDSYQDNIIFI